MHWLQGAVDGGMSVGGEPTFCLEPPTCWTSSSSSHSQPDAPEELSMAHDLGKCPFCLAARRREQNKAGYVTIKHCGEVNLSFPLPGGKVAGHRGSKASQGARAALRFSDVRKGRGSLCLG